MGNDWQIEPEALQAIERYSWPGNIRQLINAIDRAKILADDRIVRLKDLPREIVSSPQKGASIPATGAAAADSSDASLASMERAHVVDILRRERGNKARTARALGVNRRSLYRLLERYGLAAEGADAPTTDRAS